MFITRTLGEVEDQLNCISTLCILHIIFLAMGTGRAISTNKDHSITELIYWSFNVLDAKIELKSRTNNGGHCLVRHMTITGLMKLSQLRDLNNGRTS